MHHFHCMLCAHVWTTHSFFFLFFFTKVHLHDQMFLAVHVGFNLWSAGMAKSTRKTQNIFWRMPTFPGLGKYAGLSPSKSRVNFCVWKCDPDNYLQLEHNNWINFLDGKDSMKWKAKSPKIETKSVTLGTLSGFSPKILLFCSTNLQFIINIPVLFISISIMVLNSNLFALLSWST